MNGRWQMTTSTEASSTVRWQQRLKLAVAKASVIASLAAAFTGCGNIEPWVKPYERQQIADPIMAFDANPVSSAYKDHVFEAREGSRGATGSAGGGCGCN